MQTAMKYKADELSEDVMRFFTPDLYNRFHSSIDEETNQAREEWEEANAAYQDHLHQLRQVMPTPIRKLAELDLHEGEILTLDQEMHSFFPFREPLWSSLALLSLIQGKMALLNVWKTLAL